MNFAVKHSNTHGWVIKYYNINKKIVDEKYGKDLICIHFGGFYV